MKLRVNGEELSIDVTTVADLIEYFGLTERMIVVEHNRKIVTKDVYASTQLSEDDQLEIVHFVGGGI